METALYYTFSTIAQTLAGVIAILGAFALYRLQSMSAEIAERSGTIAQAASGLRWRAARELHVHGRFDEVLKATEEFDPSESAELNFQISAARIRLAALLEQRTSLRRYLGAAFWLSAALLATSLIAIATTPLIAARGVAVPAVTLGIAWFLACIGVCAKLIWSALT